MEPIEHHPARLRSERRGSSEARLIASVEDTATGTVLFCEGDPSETVLLTIGPGELLGGSALGAESRRWLGSPSEVQIVPSAST